MRSNYWFENQTFPLCDSRNHTARMRLRKFLEASRTGKRRVERWMRGVKIWKEERKKEGEEEEKREEKKEETSTREKKRNPSSDWNKRFRRWFLVT